MGLILSLSPDLTPSNNKPSSLHQSQPLLPNTIPTKKPTTTAIMQLTAVLLVAAPLFSSVLALPAADAPETPGFSRVALEARDKPKLNQYRNMADW